jgi:propanol-preferring alcohol dehydrogenase
MKALQLTAIQPVTEGTLPLRMAELPEPVPGAGEVLVRVSVCGVCHTELDEIEGRTPPPVLPVVPGHQAVGVVVATGDDTGSLRTGDRVGVAWIYSSCGVCVHCMTGSENLCADFRATGRDANGGYAEFMTVPETSAFAIPVEYADAEAAPLLCAGAIGYRSLRLAGISNGSRLGLTGFGASAHLVLKLARHLYPDSEVFVFARSEAERSFALELGAAWSGDTMTAPPAQMKSIIDTTPVWTPVAEALRHLEPGGRLVINAIRKESADRHVLAGLDYPSQLWMEKEIKSVANVARRDVTEFLAVASAAGIRPEVEEYEFNDANRALIDLKMRRIRGAKVLRIRPVNG